MILDKTPRRDHQVVLIVKFLRNISCATLIGLSMSNPYYAGETDNTDKAWMIVEHRVKNVETWRGVFDGALPTRLSAGELSHKVFHTANDLTILTVVMEWDTLERAVKWAQDPILANGMRSAGVLDPVYIWTCNAEISPSLPKVSEICSPVPVVRIEITDTDVAVSVGR